MFSMQQKKITRLTQKQDSMADSKENSKSEEDSLKKT